MTNMDNNNINFAVVSSPTVSAPTTAGRHRRLLHLHRQQFYKNNNHRNSSSGGNSKNTGISLSICIQETTFCSRASTSTSRNLHHFIMSGKRMSSVGAGTTAGATAAGTSTAASSSPTIDQTRLKIEKMEATRIQRRLDMQQRKLERAQQQEANIAAGNPGDVDFIGMVTSWRREHQHLKELHHHHTGNVDYRNAKQSSQEPSQPPPPLCVVVRKRGLNDKERSKLDFDSVTCFNPHVTIHSAKFKVDGISKYMHHNTFRLDHAFDENSSTEQIYQYTVKPLLHYVCCNNNNNNSATTTTTTTTRGRRVSGSITTSNGNAGTGNSGGGGRATVFCYGQTGSGKTFTMNGIQQCICLDLFQLLSSKETNYCTLDNTRIMVSFFELYGGQIYDLLQHDITENHRPKLKMLEDGYGEIIVTGLSQVEASNSNELQGILERGMSSRTTHQTEANDTSSRSHAICQILLYARENSTTNTVTTTTTTSIRRGGNNSKAPVLRGKLSLVDLAGSESSTDTKSHNAQRRAESSDINTSLLALKECIRALDRNKQNSNNNNNNNNKHVPYRGSKLTLLLKDCFTSPHAISTMIATVSPGASATDHSLNTLRYADRIKEQRVVHNKIKQQQPSSSSSSVGSSGGVISGSALLKKIPMRRGNNNNNTNNNAQSLSSSSPTRAAYNTTTTLPPTTPTKRASNIPTTPKRDSKFATTTANNNNTTNRRITSTTTTTTRTTAVASSKTAINSKSLKSAASRSSSHLGATTPTRKIPATPSPSSSFQSAIAAAPSLDDDFYTADEQDDDDDDDALSDPDQMQESIQVMYDQECEILSLHMQNIQENADLLTQEGKMLKDIQQKITLEHHNNIHGMMDYQYMDDYVETLASILDRKEDLIGLLQDKVMEFKQQQEQAVLLSQSKEEPELQ